MTHHLYDYWRCDASAVDLPRRVGSSGWVAALVAVAVAGACSTAPPSPAMETVSPATGPDAGPAAPPQPEWKMVWSDEFEGEAGTRPDPTKWGHDVGGNGWGNNELQFYTNRPENAALDGEGNLAITVLSETYMNRVYTSARLLTRGKFERAYGRFEARIKIPTGSGIWPAFWALGTNIGQVGWPACGEIDIMEVVGSRPGTVHGTLHGPGYSGGSGISSRYTLPDGQSLGSDFHTYAVEWEPQQINFFLDGRHYASKTPANLPAGRSWVYDHPVFIILNVAVGGNFPGNPDGSLVLPQKMLVSYVRVFER